MLRCFKWRILQKKLPLFFFCIQWTGLVVPWRWLAVAGEVPAVLMVVLLAFMPSSPRRLLSLGRQQHAERVLRWLRGNQYDVQTELLAIQVNRQDVDIPGFIGDEYEAPQYTSYRVHRR